MVELVQTGEKLSMLVVLPHRPNRYEPRVRKRRPKKYKLMNKPRLVLKKELAAQGGRRTAAYGDTRALGRPCTG